MSLLKRWLLTLVATVAFCAVGPSVATAQDEEFEDEGSSSFEEGAPVRRLLLLRSGRFEIQPQVSFSMIDPFIRNISFGAGAAYYFTNSLGVGLDFVFSPVHLETDEVRAVSSPDYPTRVKDELSLSQLSMAFDAGLIYVPIFGKFSVFGWILNYDFHLFAGAGALIMESRCADEAVNCSIADSIDGFKISGALGLGARLYFNNYVALNLEFRDHLTSFAEYGRGQTDDRSKFQQFFLGTVGVSVFFPFDVYISR